MPPALQKRNAHDVQEGILIPQGIIVTVLALLFVLIPMATRLSRRWWIWRPRCIW